MVDIKAFATENNLTIIEVIRSQKLGIGFAVRQLSFLDLNVAYCQAHSIKDKRDYIDMFLQKLGTVSIVTEAKQAFESAMVPAVRREAINIWSDLVDKREEYRDFYVLNNDQYPPLCGIMAARWLSQLETIEDYIDFLEVISSAVPIWLTAYRAAVRLKPDRDLKDKLFNLASDNVEAMRIALKHLY